MTARRLAYGAGAGSAALLLIAWGFQVFGGLAPCPLCVWQRWPHAVATGAALAIAMTPVAFGGLLMLVGALATLTTAGIGIYHTGIERLWWPGPSSCTGSGAGLGGMSGADLLSFDAPVQVALCDQVAWSMFGLSMASWNAFAGLGLAILWAFAASRA